MVLIRLRLSCTEQVVEFAAEEVAGLDDLTELMLDGGDSGGGLGRPVSISIGGCNGISFSQEAPDLGIAFMEGGPKRRNSFLALKSGDGCFSSRVIGDVDWRRMA